MIKDYKQLQTFVNYKNCFESSGKEKLLLKPEIIFRKNN